MDAKEKCFINQTANYQLNQWDPGDRILREEFNRDNARIDAAIARLEAACPYRTIKSVTMTETAVQVDIDVSDINWPEYVQVWMFIRNTPNSRDYLVRTNGKTSGYSSCEIGVGQVAANGFLLSGSTMERGFAIFQIAGPQSKVSALGFSFNETGANTALEGVSNVTWEELETLNILDRYNYPLIPAGTTFVFCGVRA